MTTELTDRQKRLRDMVSKNGGARIEDLYVALRGERKLTSMRVMQQKLGGLIQRTNSKLALCGQRIIPGTTKGTYVLAHNVRNCRDDKT